MAKVQEANHLALSVLATAAMGYPEKYRSEYACIMQAVLDLDRKIRAEEAEYSNAEHTRSMYKYGLWEKPRC